MSIRFIDINIPIQRAMDHPESKPGIFYKEDISNEKSTTQVDKEISKIKKTIKKIQKKIEEAMTELSLNIPTST